LQNSRFLDNAILGQEDGDAIFGFLTLGECRVGWLADKGRP